uniref:G-protein coupled receptors family 1 profile domain-containing protein n=1 Tax=Monopterus albus TaxID=43700 RepID=A0A3Q3J6N5_MONAL
VEAVARCPLGHFPCGNLSECLPQALQCNGHKDCPNGADEWRDNIGWADLFGPILQNGSSVKQYLPNDCLQEYPKSCKCIQTDVECVAVNLQDVPRLSPNVTWRSLRSNEIRVLPDFVFSEYFALQRFLQNNSLQFISKHAFSGLYSLKRRFLSENQISSLSPGVFRDLHQLEWVLDHNPLNILSQDTFIGLQSLMYSMVNTSLQQFPHPSFCQHMPSLHWNKIRRVPENTFQSLWKLAENLSSNRIRELPKNTFKSLSKSLLKNISHNPLLHIHPSHFNHLTHLQSALEGIEIPDIQTKMFLAMVNLSHYFKKFQYCSYAPHVRSCKPNTDGISSFEDLLANIVLRVSVWVIAFITCFGNLLVIGMRSVIRAENNLHAACIKVLCLASIWLLGFIIAAVPLMNEDVFGNYYGRNGVCFPLHSDKQEKPTAKGYSTGIFLLKKMAILVIIFSYSSMFCSIYKTGINATELRGRLHKDVAVANRFFFIVFSDALCWIPIFIVKILSLLEVEIPTISSWVVIFILPINSALNPILYTLTTSFFREQVELLLCRWQKRHIVKKDHKSLPTSTIFIETSRTPCYQQPAFLQRVSLTIADPRYA